MPTLADVEDHREAVQSLVTLAQRDLVRAWRAVETRSATTARDAVLEVIPALVDDYGNSAASIAADWYDELREVSGAPGSFTAPLAEPPPADQVEALARWGVGPMFSATPDADTALSLLSGGLQRLVVGADRGTIETSALADPARPVYTRVARSNACAFCKMLASRGAVYGSAERAGRGRSELSAHYHDHCRCAVAVSWDGAPVHSPGADQWARAYTDATTAVGTDTRAVLAHMRQSLGAA
jgi:hypothetical protein